MNLRVFQDLRRLLRRMRLRNPHLPRAVARNVAVLWLVAAVGLAGGIGLRIYTGDASGPNRWFGPEWDVAIGREWRLGIDRLSFAVPEAAVWITGQQSWEPVVLDNALPRTSWAEGAGAVPDRQAKAPWRRIVELTLAVLLGYDINDEEAVLASALPRHGSAAAVAVGSAAGVVVGSAPGSAASGNQNPPVVTGREADPQSQAAPVPVPGVPLPADAQPEASDRSGTGQVPRSEQVLGSEQAPGSGQVLGSEQASGAGQVPGSESVSGLESVLGTRAEQGTGPAPWAGPELRQQSDPRPVAVPGPPRPQPPTTFPDGSGSDNALSDPLDLGEARTTMTEVPRRDGHPGSGPDAGAGVRPGFGPGRDDLSLPFLSPSGTCRVLIVHTHTSETYRSDTFKPDRADEYHLWNTTESGIVQVGRTLARALDENYAVPTCHLTTIHDWPSHPRAYIQSRVTVETMLRRYPQIELVVDVHRDSPPDLVTTIAGRAAARVAIVVGTHPTMHPNSATNVALANHLGRMMEDRYPGLFRRVIERPDARLNQDLHPRMVVLEIGSYDTHLNAALATADLLAEVLADAVYGIRTGALTGVGPAR